MRYVSHIHWMMEYDSVAMEENERALIFKYFNFDKFANKYHIPLLWLLRHP